MLVGLLHGKVERHSEYVDGELDLVLGHDAFIVHGKGHAAEVEGNGEGDVVPVDFSIGDLDLGAVRPGGGTVQRGTFGLKGKVDGNIPIGGAHGTGPLSVDVRREA